MGMKRNRRTAERNRTRREDCMRNKKRISAVCMAAALAVSVLTAASPLRTEAAMYNNLGSGLQAAQSGGASSASVQSYPVSSPLTSYNEDVSHLAYVTDVEDQAQTSYCWAYMADAVLESFLLRTGEAQQNDFSESDMIYQMGNGGSYGFLDLTRGGSYHQAIAYWTRGSQSGPRREADGALTDYYVSETTDLGTYSKDNPAAKQDYIRDIKNLVTQYGAAGVSVWFQSSDRLQTTINGAYYYPQAASPAVNHGVTVVGWNDFFPAAWFRNTRTTPGQPSGPGAFLVKNSWGKNDPCSINGNTGYYWISYENYFQDAFAVSRVTSRSGLYDHVYETDYRGLSEYMPGSSYSRTYRLESGTERLSGFATYVKAGAAYRFFVNGQELTQFSGTMARSGYRTFRLADPLPVNGTVLQLQVEVTGNDRAVPVSCTADSQIPDSANVCLKAFTVNGTAGAPGTAPGPSGGTVTGVTVSPQDCQLRPGMSQKFQAWVTGAGQPSQQIIWQLSGNSSADTKLEQGVLYIGNNETSKELYVYALAAADPARSARARITLDKEQEPVSGPYTVTFVSEGEICKTQKVIHGASATAPALSRDGYTLQWDRDYSCITGNTVVNAVWTPVNPSDTDPLPGEDEPQEPDLPEDGTVKTVDKGRYICWKDGTAWYTKCTAKNRIMVIIPAKVRISGLDYAVTMMEENCIRGNKKVLNATVGKNVTEIGDHAFAGCENLTKIKIRSEKLEAVGEGAFRNIAGNAAIYVPRSCLSAYREMIRLSGNKRVRVKAFG